MTFEIALLLLIPVTFAAMLVIELLFPARRLPKVRGWYVKGFVFFFITGAINAALPFAVTTAVGPSAPLDLRSLGTLGGGIVGYLASDFVLYVVHRIAHRVPFIWRWAHQMHHSAERLDVPGSSVFHPFDSLFLGGPLTLTVALLGVTPDAAALAGFLSFVFTTFAHMNVRTPQWLGYVIQRPEAHSVHHGRGVHAYNYGSFMLWDILFGTFRNPATFLESTGFWDGASHKVGPMLIGRDVSEPS